MRVIRFALAIITVALISGCSDEFKLTSSTGQSVIVHAATPDRGIEQALPQAQAECQTQGLSAKVQSVPSANTNLYIFECVR